MAGTARLKLSPAHPSVVWVGLILTIIGNGFLFRALIFQGKVPVAFDYGVYHYQPWKSLYEEKFLAPPKPIGHDDIRIFYPQRKFTTDELKEGRIPFWNPHEFAGNVSLANSQTATFYPLFFPFLILPQVVAWSLLAFSIPILVAGGMYLFVRQLVDSESALFAALIFAWSPAIIVRTEDGLVAGHSLIWLPWALYGIELMQASRRLAGHIIAFSALSLSLLAGWFQFTFYVFATALVYAMTGWVTHQRRRFRDLLMYTSVFALSVASTAFHWSPALEALRHSPRGVLGTPAEFTGSHLMPLMHLATLLVPDLFGQIGSNNYFGASEYKEGVVTLGVIPLLLAIHAIRRKRWRGTKIGFFLFLALIGMVLGTDNPIARFAIAANIPLVSTFLPNRVLALTSFALAVLAGYGYYRIAHETLKGARTLLRLTLLTLVVFYAAIAAIFIYEKLFAPAVGVSLFQIGMERYLRIAIKETIMPLLLVVFVFTIIQKASRKRSTVLIAVLMAALISEVVGADRYLYFSQPQYEFPDNPLFSYLKEATLQGKERFVTLSYSRIPANIPSYFGLYFAEGVDAMYPIWYGEFASFFEGREIGTSDVLRIETTFAEELERRGWQDPKVLNLLSHLGVRYLIIPKDATHLIPPEEAFTKVFAQQWHTVYEYKYAVPRAYFVANASISENKTVSLQRIFHPLFLERKEVVISKDSDEDLRLLLLRTESTVSNIDLVLRQREFASELEEDPFLAVRAFSETVRDNPVTITRYDPNRVGLQVEAGEDGYVLLSDSFFPGWNVKIDGTQGQVLRANHAFRAVAVEEGKHTIEFIYVPDSFRRGMLIAAAGGAAVLLSWLGMLFVNRKRKDNS